MYKPINELGLVDFLVTMEHDFFEMIADCSPTDKKHAGLRLRSKTFCMWAKLRNELREEEALEQEIMERAKSLSYGQKEMLIAQLKTLKADKEADGK